MFNLDALIRESIKSLQTDATIHGAHHSGASVFLNANENSFGSPVRGSLHRNPDPQQVELKERLSQIKGVPAGNIFIGNGSSEIIDLLIRAFCNPGSDNVLVMSPGNSFYETRALLNDIDVRRISLTPDLQLNVEAISESVDEHTKLIFISSPNDPTGNSMDREDIEIILNNFEGIVVMDEAYINYSRQRSFISELTEYPNLVVLQTMSKAWGMAGARIGMAYASDEIVAVLNKVCLPFAVSTPAQEIALEALSQIEQVNAWIKSTVQERSALIASLGKNKNVIRIYPSDANFLLVKFADAKRIHDHLFSQGIVVSDQSDVVEGCLRITVGRPEENATLMNALNAFASTDNM